MFVILELITIIVAFIFLCSILPCLFLILFTIALSKLGSLSIGKKTVNQLNAENEPLCTIVKD